MGQPRFVGPGDFSNQTVLQIPALTGESMKQVLRKVHTYNMIYAR